MSGLAAQHLCMTTALNLCIGVTDTETEASVAAPLCTISDPQSQSRALSKHVNYQFQYTIPRISSGRWVKFLVIWQLYSHENQEHKSTSDILSYKSAE